MTLHLPKKTQLLAVALPFIYLAIATAAIAQAAPSKKKVTTVSKKDDQETGPRVANKRGRLFKKKSTPAPDKDDQATITRVQIFLDESQFGPGKIDGRLGQFTTKALAHYNYSIGEEAKDWGPVLKKAKESVDTPFTNYLLKDDDFGFIGDLPFKIPEQAERKYLVYRSVKEFVSERFHTDENFLTKINPKAKWTSLKPGDQVVVPNVTAFKIEDIVVNKNWGKEDTLSKRHVIVDTDQNLAAIWEGSKLIATFPVTPGQEKFIYRGDFEIKVMVNTPTFRYDKSMLKEGVRSDEFHKLPPGPNSPVGIFWAGINKSGIGLHGTASPHTIGRSQSAGCIRFANWDAIRLASLIRPGARVEVR